MNSIILVNLLIIASKRDKQSEIIYYTFQNSKYFQKAF